MGFKFCEFCFKIYTKIGGGSGAVGGGEAARGKTGENWPCE